ncbi:hypothetical protein [Caenibacillus caldisaponilyticus]|nr:hypothetical protein [Caenibacillus caldisaponilyticus]
MTPKEREEQQVKLLLADLKKRLPEAQYQRIERGVLGWQKNTFGTSRQS